MRNASVIFACPKKRRRGQNWQKRLDRMAVGCSSRSALKAVCPGYGNWRQSKRCGGGGWSNIMPANKGPRGGGGGGCPPPPSCSLSPLFFGVAPTRRKERPG